MSDRKDSLQMTLIVYGLVFIVVGMGLDGLISFLFLGLAIAILIVALFMPVFARSGVNTESEEE